MLGLFYGPVFRRAWTTPVARRSDGAGGRFRIDRLARSIGDLQDSVRAVRARGASLKATEQPVDTSTAAGKCFLDMLGVFAEFETNLRRERQLAPRAPTSPASGAPGFEVGVRTPGRSNCSIYFGWCDQLEPRLCQGKRTSPNCDCSGS
jgi:hypothetical protein